MEDDVTDTHDKRLAVRYWQDGRPIPFYDFDHRGASAVFASANGLVRFAMFHLKAGLRDQERILTSESVDAMQNANSGYGIGWALSEEKGYRIVSHSGGMAGVTTTLRLVPSEKLAIVVLSNGNPGVVLPARVAAYILHTMLPRWEPDMRRPDPPPPFVAPAELIGKWRGQVHSYKGRITVTVRVGRSEIHARVGDGEDLAWSGVQWDNGALIGRMPGDIAVDETGGGSLAFGLRLRGQVLSGPITSHSSASGRIGNALTQWMELRRSRD